MFSTSFIYPTSNSITSLGKLGGSLCPIEGMVARLNLWRSVVVPPDGITADSSRGSGRKRRTNGSGVCSRLVDKSQANANLRWLMVRDNPPDRAKAGRFLDFPGQNRIRKAK
jgi:hypothetical protein